MILFIYFLSIGVSSKYLQEYRRKREEARERWSLPAMPQAEISFLLTSGHFTNWLQNVKCSFEFTKKSDDFLSPAAVWF